MKRPTLAPFEAPNDTSYDTGDQNRLADDGRFSYEYDDEGNRVLRTRNGTELTDDHVTEYEWDHANRLTRVTFKNYENATTKIVEYTYDVFGRRIAKHLDSDGNGNSDRDEFYIYDGTDIVLDFVDEDGTGTSKGVELAKRYLWGPGVDQLLAQENYDATSDSTDALLWALTDNLGTVRDLVEFDSGTNTTTSFAHFAFDSFGNVLEGDTSATRYLFTAQEFDTETGLYHYDARYYDPQTATFISTDPIFDDHQNTYRYVGNSPTNATDPTGLKGFFDLGETENPITKSGKKYGSANKGYIPQEQIPSTTRWKLSTVEGKTTSLLSVSPSAGKSPELIKMGASAAYTLSGALQSMVTAPFASHIWTKNLFDNPGQTIVQTISAPLELAGEIDAFVSNPSKWWNSKSDQEKGAIAGGLFIAAAGSVYAWSQSGRSANTTRMTQEAEPKVSAPVAVTSQVTPPPISAGVVIPQTFPLFVDWLKDTQTPNSAVARFEYNRQRNAWQEAKSSAAKANTTSANQVSQQQQQQLGNSRIASSAADAWDWEHIFDVHSDFGNVAAQRGKPEQVFQGLTKDQIKARCQAAWQNRKKVQTQVSPDGTVRLALEGVDPVSGVRVGFWFNETTKTVETAYPLGNR